MLHRVLQHISFNSSLGKLALVVILILFLSFVLNFLLSNSFLGKSYRIFVAPGVILHELAHAFLCLLTGAQITKIAFFEKTGGRVEHKPSKIPVIGSIAISMAPFVFGAAVIYFFSRRLGVVGLNLATFDITREGITSYLKSIYFNLNIHDPKTWLIIYLVLSVAVTMTPSFQDLKNAFWSLLIIVVVIFFVEQFTSFRLSMVTVPDAAFTLLSTVLVLLLFSLVLSIITFILTMFFKPT